MSEKKPLFKKSVGPIDELGSQFVLNESGTNSAIICELCGTNYEELGADCDPYHYVDFLGYQVVMHCCGRIFNSLFLQLGEAFFLAKLDEIAKNPTKDASLLGYILHSVKKAKSVLVECAIVSDVIIEDIDKVMKK